MALPRDVPVNGVEPTVYGAVFELYLGSTAHNIEVQRSADDGTGGSSWGNPVGNWVGVAYLLPGSRRYEERSSNEGSWLWYRFRHYRGVETPSAWTPEIPVRWVEFPKVIPVAPPAPRFDFDLVYDPGDGTVDLDVNSEPVVDSIEYVAQVGSYGAFPGTAVDCDSAGDVLVADILTLAEGEIGYVKVRFYDGLLGAGNLLGELRQTITASSGEANDPDIGALVLNGDFENDIDGAYWAKGTYGTLAIDSATPLRQDKSLVLTGDASGVTYALQKRDRASGFASGTARKISAVPGEIFKISAVGKHNGIGTTNLGAGIHWYTSADVFISSTDVIFNQTDTAETERSAFAVAPATVDYGRVVLYLDTGAGSVGTLDNVEISRTTGVDPLVSEDLSYDGAGNATLTLAIVDPESRVTKVEFRTKAGLAAWGSWVEDASAPYEATVALDEKHNSHIAYRVTYDSVLGTSETFENILTIDRDEVPELAGYTLTVDGVTGNVFLSYSGDDDVGSIRYAASTSAFPNRATTQAGSYITGRTKQSEQVYTALPEGNTVYVSLLAYSGTIGDGSESTELYGVQVTRPTDTQPDPLLPYISEESTSESGTTGTLSIRVNDPAGGTLDVNFYTKQASGAWVGPDTRSSVATGTLLTDTVGLVEGHNSYIKYEVTNAAGTIAGIVVFDPDNLPNIVTLTIDVDDSGNVDFTYSGDSDLGSVRYASSTSGYPTRVTTQGGTVIAGRTGIGNNIRTISEGQTCYLSVLGYLNSSGGSNESTELYQLRVTRSTDTDTPPPSIPGAPALTIRINEDGTTFVAWAGDTLTASVRIADSRSGFPSEATTRAATVRTGQTGEVQVDVAAPGEIEYVTAFAYTNTAGTTGESALSKASLVYWRAGEIGGQKNITVSDTAPSSPALNDLWIDTSVPGDAPATLMRYNGTGWDEVAFLNKGLLSTLDAVGTTQITDDSISTAKLKADSVTANEINVAQLSAISADVGTLTAGEIRDAGSNAIIRFGGTEPTTYARYMWLKASTASEKFINHPAFKLWGDGSAEFSGEVSSGSFTAGTATFGSSGDGSNVRAINLQRNAITGMLISAFGTGDPYRYWQRVIHSSGRYDVFFGRVASETSLPGTAAYQIDAGGFDGADNNWTFNDMSVEFRFGWQFGGGTSQVVATDVFLASDVDLQMYTARTGSYPKTGGTARGYIRWHSATPYEIEVKNPLMITAGVSASTTYKAIFSTATQLYIQSPESITLDIDSDNNSTSEDLLVRKNRATQLLLVKETGDVVCGVDQLLPSRTSNFLWFPSVSAQPSADPSPEMGTRTAITYDVTNNRLYVYDYSSNLWYWFTPDGSV